MSIKTSIKQSLNRQTTNTVFLFPDFPSPQEVISSGVLRASTPSAFCQWAGRGRSHSEDALRGFYKKFGWVDPAQYFGALGEAQVMFVDTDHNDLDDRLAAVLVAYQMASANLDRRAKAAGSRCCLYLDCRTVAAGVVESVSLCAPCRRYFS